MSPIRSKTAEHMVLSKRTSAHVSTVFEIDMTRVDQLRQKHRAAYEDRGDAGSRYMPFILKAVVDALKAFPVLNASIDGDSIVYRKDINLGVAVALDWGLIVPGRSTTRTRRTCSAWRAPSPTWPSGPAPRS